MANMLDYIRWRGDLPLQADGLNEVDGLILSQLSMARWEGVLAPGEGGALRELAPRLLAGTVSVGFTAENDRRLLSLAAESARFGGAEVCGFESAWDAEAEIQFAALTLRPGDGTTFVSFRGTDDTLVGWKEDCKLAYAEPAGAQLAAARCLEAAAERYPGGLRVGGHSKGGNLAMYAAATAPDGVLARLTDVFDNDGPGLSDAIDPAALYARLAGRLRAFLPQGSVVGLLLAHPEDYTVVKSASVSLWQHNPYSWQVEGPRFVRMPGLSRDSARLDRAFRAWLAEVDQGERQALVETLFGVLQSSGAETFGREFWAGLARNPRAVVDAIRDVDPDRRRRVSRMVNELAALALHPPEEE